MTFFLERGQGTLLDEAVNLSLGKRWVEGGLKWLHQALRVSPALRFKSRCVKEAELQKTEATISFEAQRMVKTCESFIETSLMQVITREITDFPKRILTEPSGAGA